MVEFYTILGIIIGIIIVFLSLIKLRKQNISQGTFTLWMIVGVIIIIVSSVPSIIYSLQEFLGTQFTISAVFAVSFAFLVVVIFYLHQRVDMLNQKITKLIAELAANKFYKSDSKDNSEE